MSILIKGMNLPEKPKGIGSSGRDLRIWDDGTIESLIGYHTWRTDYKAVELPPHGRLIDADKLTEIEFHGLQADKKISYQMGWNDAIATVAKNAPTIVEAEGEE